MALQVYEKLVNAGGLKTDEVIETLVVQANAMLGKFETAFEVVNVRTLTEACRSYHTSCRPYSGYQLVPCIASQGAR